jgi:hypothetical protein
MAHPLVKDTSTPTGKQGQLEAARATASSKRKAEDLDDAAIPKPKRAKAPEGMMSRPLVPINSHACVMCRISSHPETPAVYIETA